MVGTTREGTGEDQTTQRGKAMKQPGLGKPYLRGSIWWISYFHHGGRERESSHSTNEKDAWKLLKRRWKEIGRGQPVGPQLERTTFDDLRDGIYADYKANERRSFERLETSFKQLSKFFGWYKAIDITFDQLNQYIAQRREEQAKPATIQNELAALKRAFKLGHQAGKAISPPFPSITVNNARKGFFERDQFEAVLKWLASYLHALFIVAYHTGWRTRSELLPMTWAQVDFQAGIMRLEPGTTKNDKGREFPFHVLPELADALKNQWDETKKLEQSTGRIIPWVFHREGNPIKEFKNAWHSACEKAGCPGLIPHDFRRTAVRNLERAGVSRSVAMKLTGHQTEAVYSRYAIVDEKDLAEGVKKLAALKPQEAEPTKGKIVNFGQ